MSAISVKLQVIAAAAAMGAAAVVVPVAANASPVRHVVGDFAQQPAPCGVEGAPDCDDDDDVVQPTGFVGALGVFVTGAVTQSTTYWTDFTILNYQTKLDYNPESPRAERWQERIDELNAQRAALGEVEAYACVGGTSYSIAAGSYGRVTRGTCTT